MQKRISPLPPHKRHGRASRCVLQAVLSSGSRKCSRRSNRSRPKTTCFGRLSSRPILSRSAKQTQKFDFPFRANLKQGESLSNATPNSSGLHGMCRSRCHSAIVRSRKYVPFYSVCYRFTKLSIQHSNQYFRIPYKTPCDSMCMFLNRRGAQRPDLSDIVRFPSTIQFFSQLYTENAAYNYTAWIQVFPWIGKLTVQSTTTAR